MHTKTAPQTIPPDAGPDAVPHRPGGKAPIAPLAVFTGLNSLGTGAVQTGVFFILRSAYGYGVKENFVFGVFLYGAYILGALAIGPMLRRRTAKRPYRRGWLASWSTRAVLVTLVVLQIILNLLPQITAWITGQRTPGAWVMWTVGLGFGVLTGMMWPIVESFLSGGRTGRELRGATGLFNILWSTAVVAAFWVMAPLLEDRPLGVITLLAVVQAGSLACLLRVPREPGRHLESGREPHPPHWTRLLRWFRVLLPVGYVLCGTLSPLLPSVIGRMGVEPGWMTPVASAWVTSRVVVFAVFAKWDGWHGGRWMPVLAGVGLVGGFAGVVLTPGLAGAEGGNVLLLILMLTAFGIGHATAYVGALYYAMELGDAEVDAGGKHEALIGLGYWTGPVLGLIAVGAAGSTEGSGFEGWLIGLALLATGIGLAWGTRKPAQTAKTADP